MKKKIGCFHAHYSNIEHIEKALGSFDVELVHFVDPGLDRMKMDADFTKETAHKKVMDTLNWMAQCHVDALLITCTFFAAVFQEELHLMPLPVIKIDDPLFHEACQEDKEQVFVFTNPATVQATMDQLYAFAAKKGTEIQVEARLLEHTFELIMQGNKEAYIDAVARGLREVAVDHPLKQVVAAQLSMVPAAQQVEKILNRDIGNPLISLAEYMKDILALERKG